MLVVFEEISEAEEFVEELEALGYKDLGQYVTEGSRLFVKEENNERLVNLHFYSRGHSHVDEMIALRDYLRMHPEVVKEYSDLKFELSNQYPDDYGSYRKFKDEWMNNLNKQLVFPTVLL